MHEFKKLIQDLDPKSKVLDVGAWGLEGDNTTEYLSERFKDLVTMNVKELEGVNLVGDFYKHKFKEKFDLIVLDLNIENNILKDWSLKELKRVRGLLKKGGMLINYVMTTDQYGDPGRTPQLIRKRWKKFWRTKKLTNEIIGERLQSIPGYELFLHEQEERRSYILWVALKKK